MWNFLSKLPANLSFIIITLGILSIVIIALRGRIKAKFGSKIIDLGKDDSSTVSLQQPSTVSLQSPKRTCSDCILLIMGEREKYELKFRKEKDRVLKTQMTFAEKKLIEIEILLMRKLCDKVTLSTFQHKAVYGLMKDALVSVKDEIRRSFKDNGFYDTSDIELNSYVKGQISFIMNLIYQYIQNINPDNRNIFDFDLVRDILRDNTSEVSSFISEIYENAKNVKLEIDNKIDNVKDEFGTWVDNFIK